MRLGFAIASDVDPDILIIDEVLAGGDATFQQKCMERMRGFRQRRTTLLFISHGMQSIEQLCTRAILIDSGQIVSDGAPGEVIARNQGHNPAREPASV